MTQEQWKAIAAKDRKADGQFWYALQGGRTDPDLFFLSGGCQGGVSSMQSLPAGSDGLERVKG